jgi:DnaJ-domain-containing protein 1
VAVRVLIPGADSALAPAASLPIVGLPYDRDSVLVTMEAQAARPRPHTAELDALFARYREPFAAYTVAIAKAQVWHDTLAALHASLDTIARSAPEYRDLYQRFADVTDSAAGADRVSQAADQRLTEIREELGGPIDSLRVEVRAWEDSIFGGYDTLVQNLAESRMRLPVSDTTGTDGWASLTLAPGKWWIYVRSWDAHDPNSEWYWNVPVTSDTLVLEPSNGRRRPRY